MNTSKSLDQILEELQQPSKRSYPGERLTRRKAAAAAIVEAVEGLIGEDEPLPYPHLDDSILNAPTIAENMLRARQRKAIKEWQ